MDVVSHNFTWMGFNLTLAFLGMLFGWLFYYFRNPLFSIIFFILWILFIPNTIYLITDLEHLYDQWGQTNFISTILLIIQYLLITLVGILSFIMSMYPIDKVFTKLHLRKKSHIRITILILVNLFIALAIVLGKYQRTHSWYVFTAPERVFTDLTDLLINPILISLVLLFALVTNLTYFAFKRLIPIK